MDKIRFKLKVGDQAWFKKTCNLGHEHIVGPCLVAIINLKFVKETMIPHMEMIVVDDKGRVVYPGSPISSDDILTREEAIKAGWRE